MVKIGQAAIDENGRITGGSAGDQTKKEVRETEYDKQQWTAVYRCKDVDKAGLIADAMKQACKNDNIGYSQSDRYSMYLEMMKTGNISKISTLCNTDCSQLVASCCIIAGITVTKFMSTSDEDKVLMGTGMFEKYVDSEHLSGGKLRAGDIMFRPGHTAIITEGEIPLTKLNTNPVWVGRITATTATVYSNSSCTKKYKDYPLLGKGNLIDVCAEVSNTYYVRIAGKHYAYVKKKYVEHATKNDGWSTDPKYVVAATTLLFVHTEAGATGSEKLQTKHPMLGQGNKVCVCDTTKYNGEDWYYIRIDGTKEFVYGWAAAKNFKVVK